MLQAKPPKCTGIINFVFGDIFSSIVFLSIHNEFGFTSTKIGFPPFIRTALAVETKVNDGRITSLFFISMRDNARFNAAVALLTAILCLHFI